MLALLPRPAILAHRGASAYAPENTLAAFERALALGVDGVELDVRFSSDGHAMVMHDRLVDRTTNGKGPIDHQPARDLRALDAGAHFAPGFAGERIPFLAEVLDLMKSKGEVQVELKGLTPGLPEEVVRLIEERDMIDQAVVTSFVHTLVRAVREQLIPPSQAADLERLMRALLPSEDESRLAVSRVEEARAGA